MNRRSAVRNLLAAGAGSLLAVKEAQGAFPEDDQDTYTLRSEVRLVLLDVSVLDAKGQLVAGLDKENFTVLENGRQQRLTVFAHEDLPVTVGILVDESFSMTPKRAQVLTAAQTLIEESNRLDEIFILNFNEKVTPGLPRGVLFSDDIQQLRAALNRGVPQGKTALYDAVADGLKHLQLGKRDKKTLVIVSDGGDNVSKNTRHDMLSKVERSLATLYAVGLYEPDDPDRDPGVLRQLAGISGGIAYFPASPAEMVPVCRRIAREIRARYTLGYLPPAGSESQRHIRVRASAADRGRLIVRTRGSYLYETDTTKTK